ncbi:cobalamin binding intrinsic factor-like isoform X2 [Pseudorasbora parva]|uniref:cobalamin binding intrinsic factor-like isoform X2 n=1 Tax=Pseudorasbora parva TaxID=51549 RepID=UPI00351F1AC4
MVVPRNLNDSTAAHSGVHDDSSLSWMRPMTGVVCKLQEFDRWVFGGAVICVEEEEWWGERTNLRSTSANASLPFPGLGGHGHSEELAPMLVKVDVTNKFANKMVSYNTTVPEGMPMFGVLNKLQDTNSFNFTYSINKSYGIYLESVNGVAGSNENHTYWELLSKKGNSITRLSVGIGCYQPKRNEIFLMNFTTW